MKLRFYIRTLKTKKFFNWSPKISISQGLKKDYKIILIMSNLVSIIMNCRNGEKFLRESLDSVIAQTYKNWELIFVDNMSTDNSRKIFEEYKDERFKYHKTNKNMNLGAARQIALNNCKGEMSLFLIQMISGKKIS